MNEGISRRGFFRKAAEAAAFVGVTAAGLSMASEAEAREASPERLRITGFPAPDESNESAIRNIEAVEEAFRLATRMYNEDTRIDLSAISFEFRRRHESIGMYIEMRVVHNGVRYQAPAYQVPDRTRIDVLDFAKYIKEQLEASTPLLQRITGTSPQ
jgi:hypothetical protein